ncbi:flagellar biosynthesis anti-sigma factor FlgM [Thalassotalea sp. LPB0316]|uniref:flagellar biosynthesis anti-sigma factor FlgM n=1 Tax=Thalassotalea sp. LPB0316 TaxID=2769490 RepID=UPI00186845DD|nr:flagellar biosynthesis anti-sigma factor FlgM [Thalassotalea sp. LPB0316]QOL27057.1 flagellar biosynthesis anti-sigma factor FlgM [Thalassotalea sp. LPB0316]
MAININNLGNSNPLTKVADQNAKQQAAQTAQQTSSAPQARQDSVSITPQAQQLAKLQQKSANEPEVNQKKVEQLKKAIVSGEYKIDPDKLAASIANFEFKLDE